MEHKNRNIEYYLLPNELNRFDFGSQKHQAKRKKNHFMTLLLLLLFIVAMVDLKRLTIEFHYKIKIKCYFDLLPLALITYFCKQTNK